MFKPIVNLVILLFLFGCRTTIPSYDSWLVIPYNSTNLHEHYIGRGQGKTFFLKFDADYDIVIRLVIDTCGMPLVEQNNPFPELKLDEIKDWWDAYESDKLLAQSCITSGAVIEIGAIYDELTRKASVYVTISIL